MITSNGTMPPQFVQSCTQSKGIADETHRGLQPLPFPLWRTLDLVKLLHLHHRVSKCHLLSTIHVPISKLLIKNPLHDGKANHLNGMDSKFHQQLNTPSHNN